MDGGAPDQLTDAEHHALPESLELAITNMRLYMAERYWWRATPCVPIDQSLAAIIQGIHLVTPEIRRKIQWEIGHAAFHNWGNIIHLPRPVRDGEKQ